MDNQVLKIPIAYRGYSSQSLITITSFLEQDLFPIDVIFVEMRQGIKQNGSYKYDKNGAIKMLFNSMQLRALAYAMKEIVKAKSNELGYEKFTRSNETKKLHLGYSEAKQADKAEMFFINMSAGEKSMNVSMNKWDMVSFADSLIIIADDTERALYKYQRAVKKNVS